MDVDGPLTNVDAPGPSRTDQFAPAHDPVWLLKHVLQQPKFYWPQFDLLAIPEDPMRRCVHLYIFKYNQIIWKLLRFRVTAGDRAQRRDQMRGNQGPDKATLDARTEHFEMLIIRAGRDESNGRHARQASLSFEMRIFRSDSVVRTAIQYKCARASVLRQCLAYAAHGNSVESLDVENVSYY